MSRMYELPVSASDLGYLHKLVRLDLRKTLKRAAVQELERKAGTRPPLKGRDTNLLKAERARELLVRIEDAMDIAESEEG